MTDRSFPPYTQVSIEELASDCAIDPARLRAAERHDRLAPAIREDDGLDLCMRLLGEIDTTRRETWRTIRRHCRRATLPPGLLVLKRRRDAASRHAYAIARFELGRLYGTMVTANEDATDLDALSAAIFGRHLPRRPALRRRL
jgi:hypothetical protein